MQRVEHYLKFDENKIIQTEKTSKRISLECKTQAIFYIYSLYKLRKHLKKMSLECKTLTIFYIYFYSVYSHPTSNKTGRSFTSLQSL